MKAIILTAIIIVPVLILVGAIFFFGLGYLPYVDGECDNWHNIMNNRATEINARQNSLGGALDVNGELHAMITQYHNDLDCKSAL